jgi:hypothetical protein
MALSVSPAILPGGFNALTYSGAHDFHNGTALVPSQPGRRHAALHVRRDTQPDSL